MLHWALPEHRYKIYAHLSGAQQALTSGHCAFTAKLTVGSEVWFAETINHPDRTLQTDLSSQMVGQELTAAVWHATPVLIKSLMRRKGMKAMQRLLKTLFTPFKVRKRQPWNASELRCYLNKSWLRCQTSSKWITFFFNISWFINHELLQHK